MPGEPSQDVEALQQRLERLSAALGPGARPAQAEAPRRRAGVAARSGFALAVALMAVGIATRTAPLVIAAVFLFALSGVLRVRGAGEAVLAGLGARDPSQPHIGMGAEVASDAVIEPGATVEMGATVGAGAVVKRGAVVRMGASVHARAVIEPDATVGWGADVGEGATVGREASVSAGATVKAGASVPAGMQLPPGSTWGSRASAGAGAAARPVTAADPREARIHAACERIEAELRAAPESVREYLGASEGTVRALRDTCLRLLERERALRAECSLEALAFLAQERDVLERRIAAATDAAVRRSLEQALAALDEQRRQRGLLLQSAERLDAELTRLVWTLDGMGTQLVRMRSAGAEAASAPDQAVLQSMQQLHEEIDAISDALEHVARGELQPVSSLEPEAPAARGARAGARSREPR